MADGEQMRCGGTCSGVKLDLPSYSTSTNFYLLELEELDVVLGVEWLKTLGPNLWIFSSLTMSFGEGQKLVILQGKNGMMGDSCTCKQFAATMKKRKKGILMCISVYSKEDTPLVMKSSLPQGQVGQLETLLSSF